MKGNKPRLHGVNPALALQRFEQQMLVENENARVAGMQYGAMAMGIIAMMGMLHSETTTQALEYLDKASEVLKDNKHIELKELVKQVNELMGSEVTTDQLVQADKSLAAFM